MNLNQLKPLELFAFSLACVEQDDDDEEANKSSLSSDFLGHRKKFLDPKAISFSSSFKPEIQIITSLESPAKFIIEQKSIKINRGCEVYDRFLTF